MVRWNQSHWDDCRIVLVLAPKTSAFLSSRVSTPRKNEDGKVNIRRNMKFKSHEILPKWRTKDCEDCSLWKVRHHQLENSTRELPKIDCVRFAHLPTQVKTCYSDSENNKLLSGELPAHGGTTEAPSIKLACKVPYLDVSWFNNRVFSHLHFILGCCLLFFIFIFGVSCGVTSSR